ncbi:hypothetical protein Gohar_009407 [Gossypium harknessii]|uniref:Uncharacterized protein n=1 Tax=Gossypium harknessii TaxID=34285 RepID=A0A7J9GMR1_9ROSI|nr:hypothetical protein [Gossypium harknessii]
MEESLIPKLDNRWLTWAAFVEETKRVGYLAGPMVVVTLSQYLLQVISTMMVGHLGVLPLASSAIAISLATVTGFSLLRESGCAENRTCRRQLDRVLASKKGLGSDGGGGCL